MAIDPSRATFVQREYRYEKEQDFAVKAAFPTARELVHDTNLSGASAATLAAALFDENDEPAQAYRVTVEDTYSFDDMAGGPLAFTLAFPVYATDGRTFKTATIEIDPMNNRTTFGVRG